MAINALITTQNQQMMSPPKSSPSDFSNALLARDRFNFQKQGYSDQQAEIERQKRARVMAVDAKLINDALANNDTERADALFRSRLNSLQMEGRDPSHTQAAYELFRSGNLPELKAGLDQVVAAAEAEGLYGSAGMTEYQRQNLALQERKLNSGAAPTSLKRLMTERDSLPEGDPRRAHYDAAITKQTTTDRAPLVNLTNNSGDPSSAATKKFGEGIGERANKRVVAEQNARLQNTQLDRVLLAVSNGANTGTGQEFILNMKNLGQTLGLEFDDSVGEQEMIRKISNEMALRLRNPESGLGLTGNTSNKDLQFLKDSVIGLARTPQGNMAIIKYMKKINEMNIAVANEQMRIIRETNGNVPNDLDARLMKFVDQYQFFTDGEKKEIERLTNVDNLPQGVTEEDIQHTMKIHKVSREEVLNRIRGQ